MNIYECEDNHRCMYLILTVLCFIGYILDIITDINSNSLLVK